MKNSNVIPGSHGPFKTVVTEGGYNHNHMSRGHSMKWWHGIECPACKHQFMPKCVAEPVPCPACGYREG